MTDTDIINVLKQKSIYVTPTRVTVFRTLLSHAGAINASEIYRLAPLKLDRVSIYRTLQVFVKKGLITVAPNTSGWPQYLVKDISPADTVIGPGKMISYFICKDCGTIKANRVFHLTRDLVPPGHHADSCQVILKGKCADCNVKPGS